MDERIKQSSGGPAAGEKRIPSLEEAQAAVRRGQETLARMALDRRAKLLPWDRDADTTSITI